MFNRLMTGLGRLGIFSMLVLLGFTIGYYFVQLMHNGPEIFLYIAVAGVILLAAYWLGDEE